MTGIMQMILGSPFGLPPTTWSPTDKNAALVLSNGNLTATTAAGSYSPGRATNSQSTGKHYFECSLLTNANGFVGIANATYALTSGNYVGKDVNSWALQSRGVAADWSTVHNNAGSDTGITTLSTDIFNCALDSDAGKLWFGINGTWIGGGDPAAGTSPTYTGVTGAMFPALSPLVGNTWTGNFGATAFAQTIPSGFVKWG